MNGLTKATVVARNMEIVTADMDGDTVMMSIENGKYYHLSTIGSAIWELLETPQAVDALIARLLETYDVSREQCETETFAFLEHLQQENIIRCENAEG